MRDYSSGRTVSDNHFKVGSTAVANWLTGLNGKLPLDWHSLDLNLFKIKCKNYFSTMTKAHGWAVSFSNIHADILK